MVVGFCFVEGWCYSVWWVWDFFFYKGFLSQTLALTGQQRKGGDHLLFYSTTSTRSGTFRHLFATLHVTWLSHIFIRNACINQTAPDCYSMRLSTLLNYYLIDWWCNVDFRLFYLLIWLGFVTDISHEKPLDSTRIDYHPCITSEPTNQVC